MNITKPGYTTQKQVRAAFWAAHPGASKRKVADYAGKRAAMYPCDTRVMFVEFIDNLARDGMISQGLANRVTLGGG